MSPLAGDADVAAVAALIADRTRAALQDEPAAGLRRVGELEIRGREGRLEAWTLDHA
jgi:class 3 adenylate cyclase